MKRNIKIISIIIFSLLLLSCGFKTINQKSGAVIDIRNIKISGDKRISQFVKNNILILSDSNSKNKYNIELNINKQRNAKIKNSAGKVIRYSVIISLDLQLTNLKDNKIIRKLFVRSGDYDVASIHSETITNESSTIKNLITQVSDDTINFISLLMRSE